LNSFDDQGSSILLKAFRVIVGLLISSFVGALVNFFDKGLLKTIFKRILK
jgi:hypothetical protein